MGVDGRGVSPLAALPPRFGKYTILGHLATGGMAEVYLARAEGIEGFEKIVVIKRIRPDLTGDRSTTKMFLHEARLAATLEHPNIAHVHEIDIVQGNYFFVMEYVHGADLRQAMEAAFSKGKRISLDDAIEIIIHVCAALHYAHDKRDANDKPLGIIHRQEVALRSAGWQAGDRGGGRGVRRPHHDRPAHQAAFTTPTPPSSSACWSSSSARRPAVRASTPGAT